MAITVCRWLCVFISQPFDGALKAQNSFLGCIKGGQKAAPLKGALGGAKYLPGEMAQTIEDFGHNTKIAQPAPFGALGDEPGLFFAIAGLK